jgi:hypothetical protein
MLVAEAPAPKDFEVASKFRLFRVASQRGKPGWFEIELLFDHSLQNGLSVGSYLYPSS